MFDIYFIRKHIENSDLLIEFRINKKYQTLNEFPYHVSIVVFSWMLTI